MILLVLYPRVAAFVVCFLGTIAILLGLSLPIFFSQVLVNGYHGPSQMTYEELSRVTDVKSLKVTWIRFTADELLDTGLFNIKVDPNGNESKSGKYVICRIKNRYVLCSMPLDYEAGKNFEIDGVVRNMTGNSHYDNLLARLWQEFPLTANSMEPYVVDGEANQKTEFYAFFVAMSIPIVGGLLGIWLGVRWWRKNAIA